MKEQFKQWLKIKGLKDRTLKNYMFYYDRLGLTTIDQESLNNFLTKNKPSKPLRFHTLIQDISARVSDVGTNA